MLALLDRCGDDTIEIDPVALGKINQKLNKNILTIWEILDDFIYLVQELTVGWGERSEPQHRITYNCWASLCSAQPTCWQSLSNEMACYVLFHFTFGLRCDSAQSLK